MIYNTSDIGTVQMNTTKNINAYIMAGGKSTRFIADKSLYVFEEKPLIRHVYEKVKPVIDNVIIVANDPGKYAFLETEIIPDIIPDLGPIGGIYTALCHKKTGFAFILPCDMPSLNTDFISYMISVSHDYDVIVPVPEGYYEPLHAIYSTACLDYIKDLIDKKEKRIINFFDKVNVRKIYEDEISFYDDPSFMFRNINYQSDITDL